MFDTNKRLSYIACQKDTGRAALQKPATASPIKWQLRNTIKYRLGATVGSRASEVLSESRPKSRSYATLIYNMGGSPSHKKTKTHFYN